MLKRSVGIVREAGKILLHSKPDLIKSKFRNDIVTNVDRLSEKHLVKSIKKYFPKHGIYSEEIGWIGKGKEYNWVIDPLDGTINFAAGLPLFSVSLGLLKNNAPFLGVVYAPKLNELFYARKGSGAYLNSKKIHVSSKRRLSDSIIEISYSAHYSSRLINRVLSLSKRVGPLCRGVRSLESGALSSCYVACGRLEGKFSFKSDLFGNTASAVIIQEAGGTVSDFKNRPWNILAGTRIASNGRLHKNFLEFV